MERGLALEQGGLKLGHTLYLGFRQITSHLFTWNMGYWLQ